MSSKDSGSPPTLDSSYLGGHGLESGENRGRYVDGLLFIPQLRHVPDPKDHYRRRYSAIFLHGKIDLRDNAEQAYEMNFGQWVEMSKRGGRWDYEAAVLMQDGARKGLYSQELLASFRWFHAGFTGASLGLCRARTDEIVAYLGVNPNNKSVLMDFGFGRFSFSFGNKDEPRNIPFFRPRACDAIYEYSVSLQSPSEKN